MQSSKEVGINEYWETEKVGLDYRLIYMNTLGDEI